MVPMIRSIKTLMLLPLLLAPVAEAYQEPAPRHALVIGNSAYRQAPLANAKNDAVDIAAALEALDYRVTLELDLEADELEAIVKRFYRRIDAERAITIFYYAGHAVQLDNSNYLLPINAGIDDVESLENSAFVLDRLLYFIKQSRAEQNVIVLDACRDNPFGDDGGTRLRRLAGGLAPVEAPANTLVAYATEPGSVSSDGSGRNGVYTEALLRHIGQSIPAEELFKKVRKDVMRATGRAQIPWEHSSLTQKFYFGPPANEEVSDIVSF